MRKLKQNITKGKIYLHSMPGRKEKLETIKDELITNKISVIICLASKEEIKEKSPEYLQAVEDGKLEDIEIIYSPVEDFQIPTDKESLSRYESTLHRAFKESAYGNVLIHCAGGIGRTGTFVLIFLRMLGFSYEESLAVTNESGSGPETPDQLNFCKSYKIV